MVALDILRNSLSLSAAAQLLCATQLLPLVLACFCKHAEARETSCLGLQTAVSHAVVVFMAACNNNRCVHLAICVCALC